MMNIFAYKVSTVWGEGHTSVGVVSGLGVPVRAHVLAVSQQAVRVFWSVSVSVSG